MKRYIIIIIAIMALLPIEVGAIEPYQGYCYNSKDERTPSPNGYLPTTSINGQDFGIEKFIAPSDLCIDNDGKIYVLDTGSNRIVVIKSDLTFDKEIRLKDGEDLWQFKNASGIFVCQDGSIFVADRDNGVVIKSDSNGIIKKKYGKPKTELIDVNTVFAPKKVAVDSAGTIYILSDNISSGAVTIDPDGNFLSFFGSNRVEMSTDILNELFWRKVSTKEQIAQRTSIQPADYSNFDIDKQDFIYTTTLYENVTKGQIKKFNPKSTNIIEEKMYGDLSPTTKMNKSLTKTAFVDVTSDNMDFFYALDGNQGKVFVYSPSAELLIVFGSMGDALGNFYKPIAIDNSGDKILVLDSIKCDITIFEPTSFGSYMRKALGLFEKGEYQEALKPWRQTLKLNSNYEPAYIGIGRALYMTGDYTGAMKYYKLGDDKKLYSKAFKKYRDEFLHQYFSGFVVLVILLWVVAYLLTKRRKSKEVEL